MDGTQLHVSYSAWNNTRSPKTCIYVIFVGGGALHYEGWTKDSRLCQHNNTFFYFKIKPREDNSDESLNPEDLDVNRCHI